MITINPMGETSCLISAKFNPKQLFQANSFGPSVPISDNLQ